MDGVNDSAMMAIAHFLVGYSVVLLLMLALSNYSYVVLTPLLGFAGGLWAMIPDAHTVTTEPLSSKLLSIHNSSWCNIFFFHYLMDHASDYDYFLVILIILLSLTLTVIFVLRVKQGCRYNEVTKSLRCKFK